MPSSARKSKATGRKATATASSTKARKANARGKLSTPTSPPTPDAKAQKQDQDPDQNQEESKPSSFFRKPTTKDPTQDQSQETPKPSRFTKAKGSDQKASEDLQWQNGKKARRRAQHNEEKKKAKRERKIRDEAERASARAKAKAEADAARERAEAHSRRPRPGHPTPPPPPPFQPTVPVRQMSAKQRYELWNEACKVFFADNDAPVSRFPVPKDVGICEKRKCIKGEKLGFCHHQLLALVMGSGEVNMPWLKKERLRWHPDKFPGREEVRERAQEMFQMLQRLINGDTPRD